MTLSLCNISHNFEHALYRNSFISNDQLWCNLWLVIVNPSDLDLVLK